MAGLISEAEYEAGCRYGEIVSDYLRSIDAPSPYGDGFENLTDEGCFHRKVMCAQAREILKNAANIHNIPESKLISIVDRLAVYAESPNGEREWRILHIGLRALAGDMGRSNVIPFSRPAPPRTGKNN